MAVISNNAKGEATRGGQPQPSRQAQQKPAPKPEAKRDDRK